MAKTHTYSVKFIYATKADDSMFWSSIYAPFDSETFAIVHTSADNFDDLLATIKRHAPRAHAKLAEVAATGRSGNVPDNIEREGVMVHVSHRSEGRKPNGFDKRFGRGFIIATDEMEVAA